MISDLHIALLAALLAAAAAFDVGQRRVPNALVASVAAVGLLARGSAGGAASAGLGLVAGAITLALLLVPFATGKLGGGDAKLAAAAAIWLGPSRLVSFFVFVAVAGAPVALLARLSHRFALWRLAVQVRSDGVALDDVRPPAESAPVAVAVLLGTFAALRWELP
ncbi:MAG TPA: prepilin peptidase [Anaeromyxobacteraceae bacterium]|nr:prepilin peptidase [Anaeromyxobacteraceae bacterium]